MAIFSAKKVQCIRDERILFNDLSFEIHPGEITHIKGPNGSGKTSLLKICCGLLMANEGDVLWENQNIKKVWEHYHSQIIYLGHKAGLNDLITPVEYLTNMGKIFGKNNNKINSALDYFDLNFYKHTPAVELSAGQKRRIGLARLLLSSAKLWILDEPLTALDKTGIEKLEACFENHLNNNGMILLATHQDLKNQKVKTVEL